ncbi:hypothetical protein AB0H34_14385 [Saccharopolyspora shandongensis]|uniref:hypothetical protein n=1 Tax=Saccharopolyspora shandongensis TaxID=418495 RepID=UPI0033CD91A6
MLVIGAAALSVGVALAPLKRVVTRVAFLAVHLAVSIALFIWLLPGDRDWLSYVLLGVALGPGSVVSAIRILRAIVRKE